MYSTVAVSTGVYPSVFVRMLVMLLSEMNMDIPRPIRDVIRDGGFSTYTRGDRLPEYILL